MPSATNEQKKTFFIIYSLVWSDCPLHFCMLPSLIQTAACSPMLLLPSIVRKHLARDGTIDFASELFISKDQTIHFHSCYIGMQMQDDGGQW